MDAETAVAVAKASFLDTLLEKLIGVETLMVIALVLVFALIVTALNRRDSDEDSDIDFEDLLRDEKQGKMSKTAAILLGSFIITSWIMIYLTLIDKMTEALLLVYVGAWIAPVLAKILKSEGSTTTTIINSPKEGDVNLGVQQNVNEAVLPQSAETEPRKDEEQK